MKPLGLHHVSINVRDVDEALQFYREVLGLQERDDRPNFPFAGAWLDLGDQQVHLLHKSVPEELGQHFAMVAEDLSASVAELRAKGIEVTDPEPVGGNLQAFLHDPSGNRVELQEVVTRKG